MKLIRLLSPLTFLLLLLQISAWSQAMKAHFINVGQGASTLLEFPCGVVLIDVGGEDNAAFNSNDALNAYLEDFFNKRPALNKTINLLVLSHPHSDHTNGIRDVVKNYTIKNVITNGQESGSGRWDQIFLHKAIIEREGTPPLGDDIGYYQAIETTIPNGGITSSIIDPLSNNCFGVNPSIKVLWGQVESDPGWGKDRYGKPNFDNKNNHSVVMRVDFGQASILFTGDVETVGLNDLLKKIQWHNRVGYRCLPDWPSWVS